MSVGELTVEKISRATFLQLAKAVSLHEPGWSAICVFLPPELLHKKEVSSESCDVLASAVIQDLASIGAIGVCARVGWSCIFGIINSPASELDQRMRRHWLPVHQHSEETKWRYALRGISPSNNNLMEVFSELEVSAHEAMRNLTPRQYLIAKS